MHTTLIDAHELYQLLEGSLTNTPPTLASTMPQDAASIMDSSTHTPDNTPTSTDTPSHDRHNQAQQCPSGNIVILDASFDLGNPQHGQQQFLSQHIPGAQFIDLDKHLSAQADDPPLSGGRHPLPSRERFAQTVARFGITPQTQVVVYDRNASAFCVRVWWMLNYLGHSGVAVLDGGLRAWTEAGLPVEQGEGCVPSIPEAPYPVGTPLVSLWTTKDVKDNIDVGTHVLLDARAKERYRGDTEPMDPRAGHIPGARSRPMTELFDDDGRFKSASELKENIISTTKGYGTDNAVVYCGSGVSATPGVLAAKIAQVPLPALYAGSFSEWSREEDTEVHTGDEL
ncbi:MAG: sulfurtransferase [Actinomycetaceae bacterium]|nr:sulfurtransferase [Actinomycetaceae bacterium]